MLLFFSSFLLLSSPSSLCRMLVGKGEGWQWKFDRQLLRQIHIFTLCETLFYEHVANELAQMIRFVFVGYFMPVSFLRISACRYVFIVCSAMEPVIGLRVTNSICVDVEIREKLFIRRRWELFCSCFFFCSLLSILRGHGRLWIRSRKIKCIFTVLIK